MAEAKTLSRLDFSIDARNPRNNGTYDKNDKKLSEAIFTVYSLDAEDAVLTWGSEKIFLSYRYDLATIIDDIIWMISTLSDSFAGALAIEWSSDTFAGSWLFEWSDGDLTVEASWREEFGASDYLKNNTRLRINKSVFLNEWGKLIDNILASLKECGYNCENLPDLALLVEANSVLNGKVDQQG